MKKISFTIITIFLTLGLSLSLQSLLASWTAPVATPPLDNVSTPLNVGSTTQIKYGSLFINSNHETGFYVGSGNIGFGIVPVLNLDVKGEIRPGNIGTGCSVLTEGAIRYSTSTKSEQYCDGVGWREFYAEYPSGLLFTNLSNQNLNTLVYSNTITPTGFQRSMVSISGSSSSTPQISCNGGAWAASCMLYVGQTLRIRLKTTNSYLATSTATVVMGGSATTWSVVTKPDAQISCLAWYNQGYRTNGTYLLDIDGSGGTAPFSVYCDMVGGGWTYVVGIDPNSQNHSQTGAITPENLAQVNDYYHQTVGLGKFSDVVINTIQNSGNHELRSVCFHNADGYGGTTDATGLWTNCTLISSAPASGNCMQDTGVYTRLLGVVSNNLRYLDTRFNGCLPYGLRSTGTTGGQLWAR